MSGPECRSPARGSHCFQSSVMTDVVRLRLSSYPESEQLGQLDAVGLGRTECAAVAVRLWENLREEWTKGERDERPFSYFNFLSLDALGLSSYGHD